MITKQCTHCKQIKDKLNFPKRKDSIDGYRHKCKECTNNYQEERKKTSPYADEIRAKARAKAKQYYLLRPKVIKNFCNIYFNTCIQCGNLFTSKTKRRSTCSDVCSKQKEADRAIINGGYKIYRICNICHKEYRYTDSKYSNQCSLDCHKKHKNNKAKLSRKTAKKNGTLVKSSHIKRARRLNAEYESGITLKRLINRDGNECLICNKKVLNKNISGHHADNGTIGHIISMANGGSHTWSNIQLECMECNMKKGVKNGGQLRLF